MAIMNATEFLEKLARGPSDAELDGALRRAGYDPADPVFQTKADKESVVICGNPPIGYGIRGDFDHPFVRPPRIRACS